MKTFKIISIAMLSVAFVFISCDEAANLPTIDVTELGYENSKTVFAGSEFHIEAEIKAPLKIARIELTIHPEAEGQHAKSPVSKANSALADWEFEKTYTGKYAGVKNAEFHEHIEIPSSAPAGHYHFHITVVDREGNTVEFEEEIEVKANEPVQYNSF